LKSVIALSEVSSCFFARQEHHLQYYLLKFAYNEVRIYCVVIMMAMMMNTSLDSRISSPKNLGKKNRALLTMRRTCPSDF